MLIFFIASMGAIILGVLIALSASKAGVDGIPSAMLSLALMAVGAVGFVVSAFVAIIRALL